MSQLVDHLANLGPDRSILKLVRAAARERVLESGRRADYVSLRPPDQAIACYVHRNRVSIAIDPGKADPLPHRIAGTRLERRGPTTYVIAPTGVVAGREADALNLLLESIDWRAAGGRGRALGDRASKRTAREPDVCPNCWTQIAPAGACMCEDNL